MSDAQPPGWYEAPGDPPGTQRYWDGAQWQGEPQPIEPVSATPPPPGGEVPPPAGGYQATPGAPAAGVKMSPYGPHGAWVNRALAILIDWALLFAINFPIWIVVTLMGAVSDVLGVLFSLLYLLTFALAIYVFGYLQGETGTTPGKRVIGLRLVDKATGMPPGGGKGVGKYFANILNSCLCYIGWLWPLWDAESQTIADKVVSTYVLEGPKGELLPIFPDGKPI